MTAQPLKTIILDLLRAAHLDKEGFLQELDETERTAIGMPHHWSAKDHVAHLSFWHQRFLLKLTAILQHQEISPSEESEASDDQINARAFEKYRLVPFSEIHSESERVYAQLITLAEQLSEEDLTTSTRFASILGGEPLYAAFLNSYYEHDQEHLAQYYSDRNDSTRATQIREKCANRVIQTEVPAWVKGWFLYDLTRFYVKQNKLEKAAARFLEALTFAPDLKEQAKSDPVLVALRDQEA